MGVVAETRLQVLFKWLRLISGLISQQLKLLSALLQGTVARTASPSSGVLGDAVSTGKQEFLLSYGGKYGYPKARLPIDLLRATEFKRLAGTVYLDHAGTTLYTEGQLQAVLQDLSENIYGNPPGHFNIVDSQSDSSTRTAELIDAARSQVLKLCNASVADYKCIFTSGATAALKLVGESFPWSSGSQYLYTMENHNSVLGLREYALENGASVAAVDVECSGVGHDCIKNFKLRNPQRRISSSKGAEGEVYNLFAFPGECNFSGAKVNLELVHHVKRGNHMQDARGKWMVLIDAAKSCGTSPPDLSQYPADYVAISFYKIFGYPTGLGALLVRNEAVKLLQKRYFSGGTVSVSIADVDFMKRRDSVEHWFEDGTPPFLAIAALHHGFAVVNELTLPAIQRHAGALTMFTVSKLMSMRHKNGREVCTVYGNHSQRGREAVAYWGNLCDQGPVIAFNLKRSDGSWVGYHEVERFASLNSIHLRGGCFCNPGACAKYIELTHSELQHNFEAGHVCWDDNDVMNGKPTGAVRVSFGYMSSYEDAAAFISFVSKYYVDADSVEKASCAAVRSEGQSQVPSNGNEAETATEKESPMTLESIIVYPIKSCAGFTVDSWYLSDTGLFYDREFCVVTATGTTLTQKMNPAMCLIQTHIDLSARLLYIRALNKENGLEISLGHRAPNEDSSSESPVTNESHPMVAEWLSDLLGVSCKLVRRQAKKRWMKERQSKSCAVTGESSASTPRQRNELSFVNEGQFLLVSRSSIDDLNERLTGQGSIEVEASNFRPNLVVSGGTPYAEDTWSSLKVGEERLLVLGGCNRCHMININPQTGHRDNQFEPLRTLSTYRNIQGQVLFGVLLIRDVVENVGPKEERVLRVGWDVKPEYLRPITAFV